MSILGEVLKMYKVTCEFCKNEIEMMPDQYNFSFNVINELFADFICSICDRRQFEIQFIFERSESDAVIENKLNFGG